MLHVRSVTARVQLDGLFVLGVRAKNAQCRRTAGRPRALRLPIRLRLEFESDLPVGLPHKISRERSPRARGDELQEIRLAGGEKLLHLRTFDRSLEDDAPRAEVAGLVRPDRSLAHVGGGKLEDPPTALRTRAERFLASEIRGFRTIAAVAEIELGLVRVVELQARRKGTSLLASKTLQRPDAALAKQRLRFRDLELAAGDDLPHPEVARLALEFLVLLVHLA